MPARRADEDRRLWHSCCKVSAWFRAYFALLVRGTKFMSAFQIGMIVMKGGLMKPPLLVALLVVGMLAGWSLIYFVV
jgi:hypothetical protein